LSLFPTGHAPQNVSPADEGRRLRVVHESSGFGKTEHTNEGVLFRWTGGAKNGIMRLRERSGTEVGIKVSDVREARVISPEVSAFDMERLAQQGWPPIESERIGDWELRCSVGYGDRANSVRVAGPPKARNLKSTLAFVEDWYAQRGVEPRLQVPIPSGMDEAFDEFGWTKQRTSRLMTNSVSRLLSATAFARERTDLIIEVRDEPNREWYEVVSGYNEERAEEFKFIMGAVTPAAFVFCRNQKGELLGIGRATHQDTWCGATTIETKLQSRRRGIAKAITARLAIWAQEQGATDWYLQVFHDNAAARSFYERFGFTTHHQYSYRRKDPEFTG
jgi:ribosomal protein S18 acetylase RimI-like enzyme